MVQGCPSTKCESQSRLNVCLIIRIGSFQPTSLLFYITPQPLRIFRCWMLSRPLRSSVRCFPVTSPRLDSTCRPCGLETFWGVSSHSSHGRSSNTSENVCSFGEIKPNPVDMDVCYHAEVTTSPATCGNGNNDAVVRVLTRVFFFLAD